MNEEANALMNNLDSKKIVLEELHNVAYLIKEAQDLVDSLKERRVKLINGGRKRRIINWYGYGLGYIKTKNLSDIKQ